MWILPLKEKMIPEWIIELVVGIPRVECERCGKKHFNNKDKWVLLCRKCRKRIIS